MTVTIFHCFPTQNISKNVRDALGDGEGSDVGQKVGPLVGFNVSTTVV
jgi:hypothetical protein